MRFFPVAASAIVVVGATAYVLGTRARESVPIKPVPVASPPPAATVEPEHDTTFSSSVATFVNERLQVCTDLTLIVPAGVHLDGGAAALEQIVRSITKNKEFVPIDDKCEAQFPDRDALAWCLVTQTVDNDAGRRVVMQVLDQIYDVSLLTKNDAKMQECLRMKGTWHAAERGSRTYREAVLERAQREAREALERLDMQGIP